MKETSLKSPGQESAPFWKRILVPVDFSDLSKGAIKIAVCLAKQYDAKITLLHVVQLSGATSIETGTAAYEVMDLAQKYLDQIAVEIPATLVGQKVVCFSGEGVSQKIVEMAGEVSSDLIVLATHAHGFIKRLLLGSTVERINRHAPCPVLVVRQK